MASPIKKSALDEFAPVGRFLWVASHFRIEKMFESALKRLSPRSGGHPISRHREAVLVEAGVAARRAYTPLEDNPDLFTIFSAIRGPGDVLRFAESYGQLGIGVGSYVASTLRRSVLVPGEKIDDWISEADAMARALDLWDRINRNDLGSVIEWDKNSVAYRRVPSEFALIASADPAINYNVSFYHLWKRGETLGPARLLLATQINSRLRQSVAPQLVFDDSHRFKEYTRPLNLLGAMWYQMCRAFTGEQPLGRCAAPDCNTWMICERSTKTMHDKCAARMRQRKYRESKNAKAKTR